MTDFTPEEKIELRAVFDQIDTDKSGEIDKLELDGIPGVSAIVNRLQINKRKGQSITDCEVGTLLKIKAAYSSDNLVLACCCILLQNFQEADYYIGKMATKEREEFKAFPINNLKK